MSDFYGEQFHGVGLAVGIWFVSFSSVLNAQHMLGKEEI